MRTYEVIRHCKACGHSFDTQVSWGEHPPKFLKCPECSCYVGERGGRPIEVQKEEEDEHTSDS